MENTKIVLISILLLALFSCNKKDKSHKHLKYDLYQRADTLFIKKTIPNINNEKDSLQHFAFHTGFNGKLILLKSIIDVKTFNKKGLYYIDKNYIYFYNEGPLYFPYLNAIPSKSKDLINYGGDYVSTDNKVFFQSKEIKNADIKTFKVTNSSKQGYYFALDKDQFYYKDSLINKDEYLKYSKND